MLREAIESKTARILKEEYGIEMSKHMKFAKPNMPTHWMKMPTHPQ